MPDRADMYERTQGPWHEGFAVTCEALGTYVTIVAGSADVAEAVANLVGTRDAAPAQPAMVGRLKTVPGFVKDAINTARRRIR